MLNLILRKKVLLVSTKLNCLKIGYSDDIYNSAPWDSAIFFDQSHITCVAQETTLWDQLLLCLLFLILTMIHS